MDIFTASQKYWCWGLHDQTNRNTQSLPKTHKLTHLLIVRPKTKSITSSFIPFAQTPLITAKGYEAMQAELSHLWRVERPDVTAKVSWAASLGDRSENADYQYNKKRLREIDRRVRYLRKRMEELKVVNYSPEQDGKVFFGAWVEVENDDGLVKKFRIVGYDEIFDTKDYISVDSPMAQALLRKEVGDDAVVKTEAGSVTWYVNNINYQSE